MLIFNLELNPAHFSIVLCNFSTIKSDSHMVAALSLNIVAYQAM